MTPDRHLGAAQVARLRPDLLISESTYATTVRESKRSRERELIGWVSRHAHTVADISERSTGISS